MVEGACCAPDAVAAGTCGAVRLSECTGGKVKRGEFCRCPEGTSENKETGACDKPSPVMAKKKKVTACKPGFERKGRRCVRSGGTITEGGRGGPAKGTETRSSGGGEKLNKPRGRSPLMGDGLLDPGIGGGGGGTPTMSGGGAPLPGAGGGGGAPRSGGFRPR
jgi:translation initiation factor IF-2